MTGSETVMAPEVGFEPTTNRLTADRSTTELLRIVRAAEGRYECLTPSAAATFFWGKICRFGGGIGANARQGAGELGGVGLISRFPF